MRGSESALIDPKEPNKASVRAFFLSAKPTPTPPPNVADMTARGGLEATLPSWTGVVLVGAVFEPGGGVDDGLEMLSITERRRASVFDALLGFRAAFFSATAEWGVGLELCSGGVARARSGWYVYGSWSLAQTMNKDLSRLRDS
jgi:hypothetical protein